MPTIRHSADFSLRALLCQADLSHVCLVIPEQMFLTHHSMIPNPDGNHRHLERFAGGLNEFTVSDGHGFGKRALEHSSHSGIILCAKANWMFLYSCVRRIDKHGFQVLNV